MIQDASMIQAGDLFKSTNSKYSLEVIDPFLPEDRCSWRWTNEGSDHCLLKTSIKMLIFHIKDNNMVNVSSSERLKDKVVRLKKELSEAQTELDEEEFKVRFAEVVKKLTPVEVRILHKMLSDLVAKEIK